MLTLICDTSGSQAARPSNAEFAYMSPPSLSAARWRCAGRARLSKGRAYRLAGAPDLRRTCARLCHAAGGEPEPIQLLLGHVPIQTTGHTSTASKVFDPPLTTGSASNPG